MPYTPILNIAQLLQGTLSLIEKTDYPHKGHPAIEHVKSSLPNALAAIHELDALQADATEKHLKAVISSRQPQPEITDHRYNPLDKESRPAVTPFTYSHSPVRPHC